MFLWVVYTSPLRDSVVRISLATCARRRAPKKLREGRNAILSVLLVSSPRSVCWEPGRCQVIFQELRVPQKWARDGLLLQLGLNLVTAEHEAAGRETLDCSSFKRGDGDSGNCEEEFPLHSVRNWMKSSNITGGTPREKRAVPTPCTLWKALCFTELKNRGMLKVRRVKSVVWSKRKLQGKPILGLKLELSTAWSQSQDQPWTNTRYGRYWNPSSSQMVVLGAGTRFSLLWWSLID